MLLLPLPVIYGFKDLTSGYAGFSNGLVIGLDNGAPFVEVTNAGTVQRSDRGDPGVAKKSAGGRDAAPKKSESSAA